jgi:hypothetical protein
MRRALPLVLMLLAAALPARAELLTSAITVQGVLSANGAPADGVYDLRLTPYGDPGASTPLAPAQEIDNVLVLSGAFTVRVDFGRALYQGDRLFIEIAVREGNATGAYELLAPRQELTAAPYALKPAAGSVTELELAPGAVGSGQLAEAAVTTLRLADAAVSTVKLADGAVSTPKLADAAVSGAKLADNAVTAARIADGAVGAAELAADAVTGAAVLDGSLTAADLAPGTLAPSGWRLDGNAVAAGQFLGTTNAAPLELRSDVGVTINGARFNNNTELTIRGSPATADSNADLGLWPRGGSAFFNLAAVGADPASANLQVAAVGTAPFTGYVARMILTYGGALGVGAPNPAPQATLHAIRNTLGIEAAELAESFEFIAEDVDAQAALLSSNAGAGGSSLLLGEVVSGAFGNGWGLWRATGSTTNVPLHFGYGTSSSAPANPSRMVLYADGSLFAGAVPPTGTPSTSFVFADDSSTSALTPSGADQFLVRATGGVGINRTPAATSTELSVGPSTAGGGVEVVLGAGDGSSVGAAIWLGTPGTDRTFRLDTGESPSGNAFFNVYNRNSASTDTPALQIITNGSTFSRQLALFRGRADGASLLPSHPIHVGDSTIPNSGNGAHLTSGGVWTNGSSRTFKHAFEAIDAGQVLDALLALPLSRWRYRDEDGAIVHLGPMAEDFHAAFGLGGDPRYIGTVDADGVALAAIQGLNAKLERENAALREALGALATRLDALERGRADD